MNKRYVVMQRESDWAWFDIDPRPSTLTVVEATPEARKTGLLNAAGQPLCVIDEPEPVGFIRWPLHG